MPPKKVRQKEPDNSKFDLVEELKTIIIPEVNNTLSLTDIESRKVRLLLANCLFSKGEISQPTEENCLHLSPAMAANFASMVVPSSSRSIDTRVLRYYHFTNYFERNNNENFKNWLESLTAKTLIKNGWKIYRRFSYSITI